MLKLKKIALAVWPLAAILAAAAFLASAAPAKPDFSGVWVVNPQKSQLAGWAKFDSTTITIEHKEPKFRFHRVSIKAGKTDDATYELTTDGTELVEKEGGRARYSKLAWDGDALVFQALTVLPDGRQATDTVRYTLKDGGKTFVAEEKFRGPVRKYDNLWVADRKDDTK
jgi:hypothetical protein